MPGALDDLRVLDLSRVLAGPWASQILADLGADVIKVERPGSGDETRHWGPPYLEDAAGRHTGESAYYLSANRGKRSLTVDFTMPEGQDIPHPSGATVPLVANPIRLSGTPPRYDLPPPLLGEHTEEILWDRLGMDAGAIAELRGRGVV